MRVQSGRAARPAVGKPDEKGTFTCREMFYTLPPEFAADYTRRVACSLAQFAGELFNY